MSAKSETTENKPRMSGNEQVIRSVYQAAEVQDSKRFASIFTADGVFNDVSAGVKYRGNDLGRVVEIYAAAFPDMRRELYDIYESGDVVLVELSLNGTHKGPLALPAGTIPATGKEMHAPCCDVLRLKGGRVQSFNCYIAATIMMRQLGVLSNLGAAFQH